MVAGKECRLADGRMADGRLAGPDDVPAITGLYLELSSESFYRRFYTARPSPALVAQFASFRSGTVCLVAAPPGDPGSLVAEARYTPIAPGTAELALTVRHDYQGARLGQQLLDALVERAHDDGLDRLRAVVLLDNTPMLRLLQRYGWVLAAPMRSSPVRCLSPREQPGAKSFFESAVNCASATSGCSGRWRYSRLCSVSSSVDDS